jgi:xylose dehydrogenase (NAD/NADP)
MEDDTIERSLTYDEFVDGEATDAYDAIYVCTPKAFHKEYVEAAADHGKAVLCEKPLEATVERAEELVAVADAGGIPLMTAYRMQTYLDVRRMRELIQAGAIGTPMAVQGEMTQVMVETVSEDTSDWRVDPEVAGYGASVMDLGIYQLNTARFVLNAEPVAANASMRSDSQTFSEVPDEAASFLVEYSDGTSATCIASQNAKLSGHFSVIGTEGELTIDPIFLAQTPQILTLRRGEQQSVTVDTGRRDLMSDEMTEEFDYFADRVLRGENIGPGGEHGLQDMQTLRAIYEAAERGNRVTIE